MHYTHNPTLLPVTGPWSSKELNIEWDVRRLYIPDNYKSKLQIQALQTRISNPVFQILIPNRNYKSDADNSCWERGLSSALHWCSSLAKAMPIVVCPTTTICMVSKWKMVSLTERTPSAIAYTVCWWFWTVGIPEWSKLFSIIRQSRPTGLLSCMSCVGSGRARFHWTVLKHGRCLEWKFSLRQNHQNYRYDSIDFYNNNHHPNPLNKVIEIH